jgi:adenine-specific DNA-methyltransferase
VGVATVSGSISGLCAEVRFIASCPAPGADESPDANRRRFPLFPVVEMWMVRAVHNTAVEILPQRGAGVIYTKPWMVELILDLAGYLPERPLFKLVALEPSAGDGAFLQGMVRRLVESCRRHGFPVEQATAAIGAFEIDRSAAERGADIVETTLTDMGVSPATAAKLARSWIKVDDFLEASLAFPIADFVIGNPPYIRLEEIPASKAAFYRSGFSAARTSTSHFTKLLFCN